VITSAGDETMNDLQKYIKDRMIKDAAFAEGFEEGYATFRLGTLLRQAPKAVELTSADTTSNSDRQSATTPKTKDNTQSHQ
jgi:HTH-type transcriptional regulator / antitoxin HipB